MNNPCIYMLNLKKIENMVMNASKKTLVVDGLVTDQKLPTSVLNGLRGYVHYYN